MKPRILVTRRIFPDALEALRAAAEVEYPDSNEGYEPTALRAALRDKHGVICQLTDAIDRAAVEAAPSLRAISTVAVGYDNIDVAAATARGIPVTHTPGLLTETTADLAFALLLATARRIVEGDRLVRSGAWRQWEMDLLCGPDVHGAMLGIVGIGRIGRAMARRARGFGMRLLVHDRAPPTDDEAPVHGADFVSLDRLWRESDFVSLHVPLLPETHHLVDAEALAVMKPTAILVNTARGPVIDEAALADALEAGSIAGAGLDVFEREPDVEPRLLGRDDVVLAPHVGSASVETRRRMCQVAVNDCLAAIAGERPTYVVNPEVFDR